MKSTSSDRWPREVAGIELAQQSQRPEVFMHREPRLACSPHEISIIPHYAGVCNVLADWVEAGRSLNAGCPHVHIP